MWLKCSNTKTTTILFAVEVIFLSEETRKPLTPRKRHERHGSCRTAGPSIFFLLFSNLHFRISIIRVRFNQWSYLHDRPCSMKPLTPIYIPMQPRDKVRKCTQGVYLYIPCTRSGTCFDTYFKFPYVYSSTVDSYVVKFILVVDMETSYIVIKVVAVPVSRSFRGAISCMLAGNSSSMALG